MVTVDLSTRVGGAIGVGVSLLLAVCAYLWGKYSVDLQRSAGRMMARDVESERISSTMERTRAFGVIFLGVMALITFIVAVKALI
jgi:hypothetical protein